MEIYEPRRSTGPQTISRYGSLADFAGDATAAAQAWTDAGFDDPTTARWLKSRCFDAAAARALADLAVTPEQAAKRTRDGSGDYADAIAYKVAAGDLTPRQAAARCMSSR